MIDLVSKLRIYAHQLQNTDKYSDSFCSDVSAHNSSIIDIQLSL